MRWLFDTPWAILGGVLACALIVFFEPDREIVCNASIMLVCVDLADENVDVKEILHGSGPPSRSLGAPTETYQA